MMDRGARTFYSPLKRVSMKQGGKVICTLLSTARANRVQSCSDLVCVRKITSSTNYSLGSMSGDAICKNRYTVRSVHLSEQGCTCRNPNNRSKGGTVKRDAKTSLVSALLWKEVIGVRCD